MLVLAVHHDLDHAGKGLLTHCVLPEDFGLCLVLSHQISYPLPVLFVVLGKLDDVPSKSLRDGPRVDNVLLVDKENPYNFVEVVLVDLDLLLQAGDGPLCALIERGLSLGVLRDLPDCIFDRSLLLRIFLYRSGKKGDLHLQFVDFPSLLLVFFLEGCDLFSQRRHLFPLRLFRLDFIHAGALFMFLGRVDIHSLLFLRLGDLLFKQNRRLPYPSRFSTTTSFLSSSSMMKTFTFLSMSSKNVPTLHALVLESGPHFL